MTQTEKIRIFVTGGTFDKEYDEIKGELIFKETHVQEMLKKGRCLVPVEIQTIMMVDSLDMTETQRLNILEHCQQASEDRIIITHGTDTMVETARLLGEHIMDKTIVLTGAMIPYWFGPSDGLFNLGCAVAFAQALAPGVYVAMNGRYFLWHNVVKESSAGIFKSVNN